MKANEFVKLCTTILGMKEVGGPKIAKARGSFETPALLLGLMGMSRRSLRFKLGREWESPAAACDFQRRWNARRATIESTSKLPITR